MSRVGPKESQAIAELASHFYDYLPASSPARDAYTFGSAAEEVGVGHFWRGGKNEWGGLSKEPAIQQLLHDTLEQKPGKFCELITVIVSRGIHRRRRKDPLTRKDIEFVNRAVERVGFKIPELYDLEFLEALPDSPAKPAPVSNDDDFLTKEAKRQERQARLADMRDRFIKLQTMQDRQKAGLELELLLNALFEFSGLKPTKAFKIVGEQIDGAFELGEALYLVEAKWQKQAVGNADTYVFKGKVEGKAKWTRGLFISVTGFSEEGVKALRVGKTLDIVLMDGTDLYYVFDNRIDLMKLLRDKARWLGERGEPFIGVNRLLQSQRDRDD